MGTREKKDTRAELPPGVVAKIREIKPVKCLGRGLARGACLVNVTHDSCYCYYFPPRSSKVSDTLLWTPFSLLQAAGPSAQSLPRMINSHTVHYPISASATCPQPPCPGTKKHSPLPHTRYHSEHLGPLPVPPSCNYVEQTSAADGKGAAISLTFRGWSCWDNGEAHGEGAP